MRSTATRALLALAVAAGSGAPVWAQSERALSAAPDQHAVYRFPAALYNVDPELLEAIASVESGGDAHAVSPKGAQGLMQLLPETSRRFGVRDPFDAVQNTLGAARFLSHLKWRQIGRPWRPADLPEVLAAYNAGPGAVEKFGGVPPYRETEEYVRRVLIRYLLGEPPILPPGSRVGGHAFAATSNPLAEPRSNPTPPVDPLDQLCEIKRLRAQAQGRRANVSPSPTVH